MAKPFLTAEWRNLGLINFAVDSDRLKPHLPCDCAADLRDGRAFVSFVMFDFLNTRVKGIRWPGFVNFPEINLRFYVQHGGQRGVCFIRELVPSRLIAWIARTIYNEPYVATRMTSRPVNTETHVGTEHRFWFAGRWHTAVVRGRREANRPDAAGIEHFFKEHSWGFGRSRSGALRRYEVQHPVWDVYPDASAELDVDFALVYGREWSFLNEIDPHSVVFAVGSGVAVFPHRDGAA